METVGRAQHNTLEQAVFHAGIGADVLVMGVFLEGYKMALALRSAFYKELSIQGVNSFETPIEGNRILAACWSGPESPLRLLTALGCNVNISSSKESDTK